MKKILMFTILPAMLTLAIVTTAYAWYALASCNRLSDSNTAMGMAGSWGLHYGTVTAIAEVDDYRNRTRSFLKEPVSAYAYDKGPRKEPGYAKGDVSGLDNSSGEYEYRSMSDTDSN